jgi:dienelactone hydrolase
MTAIATFSTLSGIDAMRTFFLFACMALLTTLASSELKHFDVEYTADSVTMKGYLVYDDAVKGKRPGVLVVHEWWGYNDYARHRATMLAGLGYTALAIDMYGGGKQAAHPDDAATFSAAVMKNMPAAKARFLAALELLKRQETVDTANIGAIGYCFGGGVVLNMIRMGVDLKGAVTFHASLGAAVKPVKGEVKTKVLVCHGAADAFASKEDVENFKKEMRDAGIDLTFRTYAGAQHSFTNPAADAYGKKFKIPLAYNAKADHRSWADMKAFFKRVFSH